MPADLAAFDRLATPLFWLDAEGRILATNPAFASWPHRLECAP
jgi:hypothetical protein